MATYYFAMSSVSNKTSRLSYAAAKQDMLILEDSVASVSWSPGSSVIRDFQGHGGKFETKPEDRDVIVNLTFGSSYDVAFNSAVGYARYEMPYVDLGDADRFLRGDPRNAINQSFGEKAQMYMRIYGDRQEIYLGYRPLAISFLDNSGGNMVNVVRIYLINLNSSESLLFTGGLRVRVQCMSVATETQNHNFTGVLSSVAVNVSVDGDVDTVHLPLSSEGSFTLVRVEILVCNVRLEEVTG